MEARSFAAALDRELTNPLLRGLDIACVRTLPGDATWWSPHTHRVAELYLYPGPFGADQLGRMRPEARQTVETAAARVLGAHECRLLPARPVPLRAGEWLMELGYSLSLLGPMPSIDHSATGCTGTLLCGAVLVLAGRGLYELMWQQASRTPGGLGLSWVWPTIRPAGDPRRSVRSG